MCNCLDHKKNTGELQYIEDETSLIIDCSYGAITNFFGVAVATFRKSKAKLLRSKKAS